VVDGSAQPAAEVLRAKGIAPLVLQAKEGLALINGTQTSTALALHALFSFEPVLEAALVIGALTVDAARGSDGPFDPRIHALRGQPGQIDVAQVLPRLLAGSAIRASAMSTATTACRTRTACAASRRWWAPAWTSCATPRWCCCARPMR
jgi:histidine ammonia-lyase